MLGAPRGNRQGLPIVVSRGATARRGRGDSISVSRSRVSRGSRQLPPEVEPRPAFDTFAAAFEHATIGMAIGTPDGRLRDANPAFVRLLGYTREELLGLPISAVTHLDDQETDAAQWRRLEAGEFDTYQQEKRYQRKDGSSFWAAVTVCALRDEAGRFLGTTAQMQDISAQRAAEATLREHEAHLASLVEQLPIVLYSQPWEGRHTIGYVSPRFTEQTGLRRNDIPSDVDTMLDRAHPDDRQRMLAEDTRANGTGAPVHLQYRLRGGHGDWVWIEHRSVLARDEQGQPLTWYGSLLDISEQKRLEATLRASEERISLAFRDTAIGMAIGTPDNICLDVNDAYCQITGYSREELVGHSFQEFTHPDDREAQARRLARLVAGEADSIVEEKRYLHPDGYVITTLVTVSAVRDETGTLLYCIGQVQDITAQKSAEAALHESEQVVRSVMEQAPAAVYRLELGPEGRFIYASARFTALTGLSLQHTTTLSDFLARVHPEDLPRLQAADAAAAASGESFDVEYRIRGEDSSWVWLHDRSTPARDDTGQVVAWNGVLVDISERMRLQAALREHEARVQTLIEHLPVALYSVESSPGNRYTYTSPQFELLTGLTPEEIERGVPALDSRIHPDDLTTVQALSDDAEATGAPIELEYRVLSADGAWHWVYDRSTLARDADDNPRAWHGVLLDISDRKRLEEALAEREERLRVLIEQLPVAVYSLEPGPDARYTYVSPQFGELTGMSPEEIARGNEALYRRIHPDDVARVREADRLSAASRGPHAVEFRVLHPDGRWVWLQERAMLALNAQGKPLAWHGVLLDISEQRRLEQSLRESEARFRSTFEDAAIGMALSTPDCRVLMANPALEHLLGFGPGELTGALSDDLTYPDDLPAHSRLRERLAAGEIDSYHIEKRYLRRDGEIVWVIQSVTAVRDDEGEIQTLIAQIQDITSRKEAAEALRESEARFRSTFEGAGTGMTIANADGVYLDVNPAFCRMVGRSREELLGLNFVDITHPDDLAEGLDQVRRLRTGEIDAYSLEKRYVHADGRTVWGHLTVTAVRETDFGPYYEIAQIEDITSRKAAEAALRASEARFRALVQNDPDVVIIIDDSLTITYASPSSREAFGVSAAEVIGSFAAAMEWIHPDDAERALALYGQIGARRGAVVTTEARIKHPRQGWRWFHLTIANLIEDPGIAGYLINMRDISDRKRAELATATALKAQQAAIVELERLNQSKSRFLSTISHEFRTPLTAIIGYSEFLASNAADPGMVSDDAAVINREARRLNRMVDDVLLLDRVDARRVSLARKSLNLKAIVQEVVETFRPLADRHTMAVQIPPDLPALHGDPDRIAQALTNLVSNAIKYSPEGGTITISARHEDDDVVITVCDTGIGIADADQQRIFDRFERVEAGIAGRIAGTGLGLSIVQEIAMLHGGRIWVDSAPGAGACFSIALPVLPRDDG